MILKPILNLKGVAMSDRTRVFVYKRGDQFSVDVVVNELAASVVFSNIVTPENSPAAVKELFLEEAEKAVTKQLEGDNYAQGS